ncbi:MAG TPA: DUF6157 family protein [Flavobacteriales bacterium]
MKTHTTNYLNTFICVAPDCKVTTGTVPPQKDKITAAHLQYELVSRNPYKYTSDDVLFMVHAAKNDLPTVLWEVERAKFFSKPQACFRSSPLSKQYGWGIHCNNDGKIALYGMETEAYQKFLADPTVKVVPALRTQRQTA